MAFKLSTKQRTYRRSLICRKSDLIYHLTDVFCKRFLSEEDQCIIDQMMRSARNCKIYSLDDLEETLYSTEMELKLLSGARASLQELREEFEDYLNCHFLSKWSRSHSDFENLLEFCRNNNDFADYASISEQLTDEELANMSITTCHIIDKVIGAYLEILEKVIASENARKKQIQEVYPDYRRDQEALTALLKENERLKELLRENGIPF